MKTLHFNIYRHGDSGFSNLLMSVELGVVLAALTKRLLVLSGNQTPPANVVEYNDGVSNRYRSRVTDLVDLGVPWVNEEDWSEECCVPHDLCTQPADSSVFYYPPGLSTQSEDFISFARGRQTFTTIDDEIAELPALAYSGGPGANTLCFYSYLFYFNRKAQEQAFNALAAMQPKEPYLEFAQRVAGDLGSFNAAHIRRGDFKLTRGVTTNNRKPEEVIAALDLSFRREDLLVILTDEADDPFFDDIKSCYNNNLFIDYHILDRYRSEFAELPMHDSIALAYLSQLIAARSKDFIGTMTSTFTATVQRMRGNLGLSEPFKFLWNELAPEGAELKPGSHVISDDVPLANSIMIEQFEGPYSWNRYNQRLSPSWMREWPEAFLHKDTKLSRSTNIFANTVNDFEPDSGNDSAYSPPTFNIGFQESSVLFSSDDKSKIDEFSTMFAMMKSDHPHFQINDVRVHGLGDELRIALDGKTTGTIGDNGNYQRRCYREIVRCFIYQHSDMVWIHAGAAASDQGAIVLPGPWGHGKSTLTLELYNNGWQFLSDDIVPLEPNSNMAVPFPVTPKLRKGTGEALARHQVSGLKKIEIPLVQSGVAATPQPISMIVFPNFSKTETAALRTISPGQCVGKLLENSLSFPENSDEVIDSLCRMVEKIPAFDLQFRKSDKAAQLLIDTAASLHSDRAKSMAS